MSKKGHPCSEETKESISKANKGRIRFDIRGIKRSEEFCIKVSEGLKRAYANTPQKERLKRNKILSLCHLGIKHSVETKRKMSETRSKLIKIKFKGSFRKDLNHYVRSSWEANFARILKYLKEPYEYEKYTFKVGEASEYTPDFYLKNQNIFIEIKGYLNEKGRIKIEKFKEIYLNKKLIVVDKYVYKRLKERYSSLIENWEKDY